MTDRAPRPGRDRARQPIILATKGHSTGTGFATIRYRPARPRAMTVGSRTLLALSDGVLVIRPNFIGTADTPTAAYDAALRRRPCRNRTAGTAHQGRPRGDGR